MNVLGIDFWKIELRKPPLKNWNRALKTVAEKLKSCSENHFLILKSSSQNPLLALKSKFRSKFMQNQILLQNFVSHLGLYPKISFEFFIFSSTEASKAAAAKFFAMIVSNQLIKIYVCQKAWQSELLNSNCCCISNFELNSNFKTKLNSKHLWFVQK